jgi:hypothetical protein
MGKKSIIIKFTLERTMMIQHGDVWRKTEYNYKNYVTKTCDNIKQNYVW